MQNITSYETNGADNDFKLEEYLPLVTKIALHIKRRLPSHIELDDLVQSGIIGLIEAHRRFEPGKEASFDTFAGIRIHGAIIDELRKNSWGTREAARYMRLINKAMTRLEQQGQSHPLPEALAQELGISVEEYHQMVFKINTSHVISMEYYNVDGDTMLAGEGGDPSAIHEQEDMKERLKYHINQLPERDQQILALYYLEEFSLKQIGEVFSLTEARICQLHAQALARLRAQILSDQEQEEECEYE